MKKITGYVLFSVLFLLFSAILSGQLRYHGKIQNLSPKEEQREAFRSMELNQETLLAIRKLEQVGYDRGTVVGTLLPWNSYQLFPGAAWDKAAFEKAYGAFQAHRNEAFEPILKAAKAIWNDPVCFPVNTSVTYENSWMAKRNYGGERGHEGCDLMPEENRRDFYPVLSMTDGTVEKIGWLPKGGYRIGIRSSGGGYFYYAHFSSYAKDWSEGDFIQAGDTLGYMGDSGYGKEGTVGKFDVHLHLGIYITGQNQEEISVNPYWILKMLAQSAKETDAEGFP